MPMSRRSCLLWGAGIASGSLLSACAVPTSNKLRTSVGAAQLQMGSARITALSEGIGRRPLDAGFVKNVPLAEVQAVLAAANLPTTHIDVPYTCYVVELHNRRYLLDTGFADNGAAGTGHLHQNMRHAGIDPDSIDTIIISHMHGDHIQGLRRKDGSLVYPQATVYVPYPEMTFWMDDARMQAIAESARGGFAVARRVFKDYPRDRLKTFMPGTDIAPGIGSIAAFGHSPGHTAISVQSSDERFTSIGDAAHLPELFVRNPDWQVQFDMNPDQARMTRHALLGRLAKEKSWVGGYHFPLPGIGKLQKSRAGYKWLPQA